MIISILRINLEFLSLYATVILFALLMQTKAQSGVQPLALCADII